MPRGMDLSQALDKDPSVTQLSIDRSDAMTTTKRPVKDVKDVVQGADRRTLRNFARPANAAEIGIIHVNSSPMIDLGSNDYLGLAVDETVLSAAKEAIETFGLGASGSRALGGNHALFAQLEMGLADLKGTPSALVLSSGFLANIAAVHALVGRGDTIFVDRAAHASLIEGCLSSGSTTIRFRHNDMADLEEKLRSSRGKGRALIITEGLFSMDGDVGNIPGILELARAFEAQLLIDDAHATGTLGAHGTGVLDHFRENAATGRLAVTRFQDLPGLVITGSLSKSLGALGGFVCCSEELREHLVNRSRQFLYSTALPAGVVAGATAALGRLTEDNSLVRQLHMNASRLRHELAERGLVRSRIADTGNGLISSEAGADQMLDPQHSPIIPVVIGTNEQTLDVQNRLMEQGIYAPAIRPPTVPEGTSRIRISVSSKLTAEQIDKVLKAFQGVGEECDLAELSL